MSRRPKSQMDRVERLVTKIGAHVYGGVDPDTGEPVISHKQRLDAIEASMRSEKEERRWAKLRATVKEGARIAAAAAAGVIGGHASK